MPKFHGRIGFGETAEVSPGVHVDIIVETWYYGDVVRNQRSATEGESVNPAVSVGNAISIVGTEYARTHIHAIRYVSWAGVLWTVPTVQILGSRLVLQLGEVYNGPTAESP